MAGCRNVQLEHHGQKRVVGWCRECDWHSNNWRTGAIQANAHTKETGHEVLVEKIMSYTVKPK